MTEQQQEQEGQDKEYARQSKNIFYPEKKWGALNVKIEKAQYRWYVKWTQELPERHPMAKVRTVQATKYIK